MAWYYKISRISEAPAGINKRSPAHKYLNVHCILWMNIIKTSNIISLILIWLSMHCIKNADIISNTQTIVLWILLSCFINYNGKNGILMQTEHFSFYGTVRHLKIWSRFNISVIETFCNILYGIFHHINPVLGKYQQHYTDK